MEIDVANEQVPEGVAVRVRVRLSGRETSRLFLSGDTLIQLPLDGALTAYEVRRSHARVSSSASWSASPTASRACSRAAPRPDAFARVVRGQLDTALEAL